MISALVGRSYLGAVLFSDLELTSKLVTISDIKGVSIETYETPLDPPLTMLSSLSRLIFITMLQFFGSGQALFLVVFCF